MSERAGGRQDAGQHGHAGAGEDTGGANGVKLAIAWTIVGVPLAYGISQTLIRASQLFTG